MITKITVTSKKTDWDKIKSRLLSGSTNELRVGFFKEDTYGPENNNLPVAAVAAWQDLGAPFMGDKNIPPRPFMRIGLKNILKSGVYTNKYKQAFLKVINGRATIDSQYQSLGGQIVPALKKVIDEWTYPPNQPSTIKQKGNRNDPLIDTGFMRDSVKAKVFKSKKTKG
jgi:hypothetical protein